MIGIIIYELLIFKRGPIYTQKHINLHITTHEHVHTHMCMLLFQTYYMSLDSNEEYLPEVGPEKTLYTLGMICMMH